MTAQQRRRGNIYTWIATVLGVVFVYVMGSFWEFGARLPLMLICMGLAVPLSMQGFWWVFCRKDETRRRGGFYGFGIGVFSLFLFSLFIKAASLGLEAIETDGHVKLETILGHLTNEVFFMFSMSFALGGFTAPLFGALAGYLLAKPIAPNK